MVLCPKSQTSQKGSADMKNFKILSVVSCTVICLTLASCGQDSAEKGDIENKPNGMSQYAVVADASKFFAPTTDIVKTEGKFVFQNVTGMAANVPKFYETAIFANKMELVPFKHLEFVTKVNTVSPVPTYFGFDVYSEGGFESIVADESKYFRDLGYASVFDTANNLAYMASAEYVYCSKLTKSNQTLSWKLEIKNAKISDRTIGNQIIVFDSDRVLLVDTQKVSVTAYNKAKDGIEILHVIPNSGKIWVFAKEYKLVGKEKQYQNNGLTSVYRIDPKTAKDNVAKFSKNINLVQSIGKGIAFCIGTEFHVFEGDSLNVFDVAKIHEGVKTLDTDSTFNSVEVGGFWFTLGGKQYFLDVLNPARKIELPKDFKIIHSYVKGHGWDYCVAGENGWSGYDVLRDETTWSIATDGNESMTPYLSTENGVLFYGYGANSDTYVVKVYTPKK